MLKERRARSICAISFAAVAVLVIVFVIAFLLAKPKLIIENTQEQLEVYSDLEKIQVSAEVRVLGIKFNLDTTTAGEVDTNKLGEYELRHTASFFGKSVTKTQKVKVVDKVSPETIFADSFCYLS